MASRDGQYGGDGNLNIPYRGAAEISSAETPIARAAPRNLRPQLRKICSYCRVVLEAGDPGAETTDAICEPCLPTAYELAGLGAPTEPPQPEERLHGWDTIDTIAMLRGLGLEPLPGGVA